MQLLVVPWLGSRTGARARACSDSKPRRSPQCTEMTESRRQLHLSPEPNRIDSHWASESDLRVQHDRWEWVRSTFFNFFGFWQILVNLDSYLGVTPPISMDESTPKEKEVTISLMEELRRQNIFESEEESRTRHDVYVESLSFWSLILWYREVVLGRVAALVKKFVRKVSLARGLSEVAADAAGGEIFTFGSYRLGVHFPGSDIDTLCVVPKQVSREDFFDVFEPMLREVDGVSVVSVSLV